MRTVVMALSLILLLVSSSGCATVGVPLASLDEDRLAKSMSSKPDKSLIYVYRDEYFGGAIPMTVSLNGRVAGQTGPKTYFMWEVTPGRHEIASHTENVSTLTLQTEPGRAYFIWQEVKMGMFMARSLLQQVDEETGRKAIAECQLLQSAVKDQ